MKMHDECHGCREVGSHSTPIGGSYNPLRMDAGISIWRELAVRLAHFDLDPEAIRSVYKAKKARYEYIPR